MPQDQPQPAGNSEEQVLAGLYRPESVRFADQLRIPQFGIIHMLLWMTVTAVLLKINLALWDNTHTPPAYVWLAKVWIIVRSVLMASELVTAGVLLRAKCCTMLRRLQPGHWLVLILALDSTLRLTYDVGQPVLDYLGQTFWVLFILAVLLSSPVPGLYVLATLRLRDARRWKVLLGAKAIGECSFFATLMLRATLGQFGYPFSLPGITPFVAAYWHVFVLILLVAAVALDWPRRGSRDWVHWLGVFCFGFGCAAGINWRIILSLFV